MNEFGQDGSMRVAVAPVASPSAGQGRKPPPAWDRGTWLVAIPLAFFVIYAFIPILDNGFVDGWDDDPNFRDNPYFRGLGAAQVRWAWTTFWVGVYQPLAWLLFEVQYFFCELDPRGYHLTSLLLQVANAVVLYVLTVALLARCRTGSCLQSPWTYSLSAGLATALFAVHPLRVEAVAWASCQPYLPCALFSMLSVLTYLRAFPKDSSPQWGWLVGSFLLFVAALLFKAPAVSLPVVLLILDVYPLRRLPDGTGRWFGTSARKALLEKVPFVATSLLFMRLAIAAKPDPRFPVEQYDASEGIAQACYGTWFYILKTVLPLDLIVFCPLPNKLNWLAFPYSLSILATLAMSAGLFFLRRRWPGLLAAWLSYLVILAPNSGIIRFTDQIAADRYSYLPMLGSVMLAAAGFCWLWPMISRRRPGAIGISAISLGALLGLAAMTRNQCRTWLNSETLWAHALAHGPNDNWLAHYNMGVALQNRGNYQAAKDHYTEALRLHPGYDQSQNNLGNVLSSLGRYEEAETHFTEAVRINPGNEKAHGNLGKILSRRGKYDRAEAHFSQALQLNPGSVDAHTHLGKVLYRQGKYAAAATHFTEALWLNPGDADLYNNLGTVLARQRRYAEAEGRFAEAIRLQPGNIGAHFNLGLVHAQQGKHKEAAAHYAEAIRLQPGNVGAHLNLGNVLARLGSYEAAKAHYAEAIRLDPSFAEAYNAIAMIMAACPEAKFRDGKGAVALATRACELTNWKDTRFLNTLAVAQAEAGDFDAAVNSQNRAIELLTDTRQQDDYRSRLVLYQAKRPYRQESPQPAPIAARP